MGANLKEVRERISSVKSTQQITKAMKMVSAAKLKRATDAIVQMRPYSDKLDELLSNLMANLEGDASSEYGQEREVQSACVVIVTSNRGLCGGFNSNIIKASDKLIADKYADVRKAGKLTLVPIGKKGYEYAKKHFSDCNIVNKYVELFNDLSSGNVSRISKRLISGFLDKKYDSIDIAYSRFKNAAMQFAEIEQFLPVKKIESKEEVKHKADYIFEPNKEELLIQLIPSILQTSFQKYLLDTHASEHGARMTAMDNATENAEEMVNELKIQYNKARQEAITRELSEIVGGAAALAG